jgi:hypothetical protein
MNVYCGSRPSRAASLFSLRLLNEPQSLRPRPRRPCFREVSVGFGPDLLVTTFMKNPG